MTEQKKLSHYYLKIAIKTLEQIRKGNIHKINMFYAYWYSYICFKVFKDNNNEFNPEIMKTNS